MESHRPLLDLLYYYEKDALFIDEYLKGDPVIIERSNNKQEDLIAKDFTEYMMYQQRSAGREKNIASSQ